MRKPVKTRLLQPVSSIAKRDRAGLDSLSVSIKSDRKAAFKQRLLDTGVVVDRRLGHAEPGGDVIDRGRAVAAFNEGLGGSSEDGVPLSAWIEKSASLGIVSRH